MTEYLAQLASLAASLPPGAVLAHVVTDSYVPWAKRRHGVLPAWRSWAKIGDEPWRSVRAVRNCGRGSVLDVEWLAGAGIGAPFSTLQSLSPPTSRWAIVTDSVVWEQGYGLRGRHEAIGVLG